MSVGIDLNAVFIADYVGVLLLILILLARGWDLPGRRDESRILFIMIIATMIDCLVDPFVFLVDGRPGSTFRCIAFFGNSILYLYNLVVGTGVLALVVKHINKTISRFQYVTVCLITVVESILLVINIFNPIVFSLDENNVYKRGPLYFVYIVAAFYLLIYSLTVYFTTQFRDGSLRYFPVWEFILPITIGVIIQTACYGLSVQPVCFAISFCSIVICLQKECLYIDKLTGVYNMYELDKIVNYYVRRKKKRFAAIMLDLNSFKSINDNYSHKAGDEALIAFANILSKVTQTGGNVIRFAGDEFVLIADDQGENTVKDYCDRIENAIEDYNRISNRQYELSASMGGDIIDINDSADFIGRIDRLMYENKREYYMTHDRRR
ncbi:MAG: GGDEF domain-containing protein [Lachnospiraceae bacterium]|nr:GGDEF domain-containing protein [Lachnospiraceae bacterium]